MKENDGAETDKERKRNQTNPFVSALGSVYIIPDSSCDGTKSMPERASVHT